MFLIDIILKNEIPQYTLLNYLCIKELSGFYQKKKISNS